MKIFTIDESTKNPLGLKQPKGCLLKAPLKVESEAKNKELWHLIAWRDVDRFGFYHKNKALTIEIEKVKKLAINYMTRAKGKGWIALEVESKGNGGVIPILESHTFKQEALDWFNSKLEQLREATGLEIEINDYGPDC